MNAQKSFYIRVCFWILVFVILGVLLPAVDFSWTSFLHQNSWESYSRFMEQSCAEGHAFGGGDIGNIFTIVIVLFYFASRTKRWEQRFAEWSNRLGFLVVSSSILALALHGIKVLVARPRPYLVVAGTQSFSQWYQIGSLALAKGHYSGSFPSGHVGSVIALASVVFVLEKRWQRVLVGCLIVVFSIGMAVARSMAFKHWISDGLLFIPFAFVLFEFLNHYFFRNNSEPSATRGGRWWELVFLLRVAVVWISFVMAVVFVRKTFLLG